MNEYFDANRKLWDEWTKIHVRSEFYDVEGFKNGRNTLCSIEKELLGDVAGKSLLHLQCHFGLDTLSWARLGARVTGVDFSPEAIKSARQLRGEVGLDAEFILANLYDLPTFLSTEFDIVFTSYGAIFWLPDLVRWAQVFAQFLRPAGTFLLVEGHPFANVFENEGDVQTYDVRYPYFHTVQPTRWETNGSYAEPFADVHNVEYGWQHSISDVLNSLISAGLEIEYVGEYPIAAWQMYPFMVRRQDGWWHLPEDKVQIPLTLAVKAKKRQDL